MPEEVAVAGQIVDMNKIRIGLAALAQAPGSPRTGAMIDKILSRDPSYPTLIKILEALGDHPVDVIGLLHRLDAVWQSILEPPADTSAEV